MFKPGDVVKLKSGDGPEVVVAAAYPNGLFTGVWVGADGDGWRFREDGGLYADAFEPVDPPAAGDKAPEPCDKAGCPMANTIDTAAFDSTTKAAWYGPFTFGYDPAGKGDAGPSPAAPDVSPKAGGGTIRQLLIDAVRKELASFLARLVAGK